MLVGDQALGTQAQQAELHLGVAMHCSFVSDLLLVLGTIEWTVQPTESNRIESNPIESNRIESNRIESNPIEPIEWYECIRASK